MFEHGRVLHLEGHDHDLIRGERQRPDDAVRVVPAFDGAGENAVDADAVAAHDRVDLGSLFVQVGCAHRLRILGAELEYVADLEACLDLEGLAAAWAGITGLGVADIEDTIEREVAARDHAGQVHIERRFLQRRPRASPRRRYRSQSGILMPTGPRNPMGAPVAFSIVAASAGVRTDAPT